MTVKVRERVKVTHAPDCTGTCGAGCARVTTGWTADIRVRRPSGVEYRERAKIRDVRTKAAAERWAKDREAHLIRFGPEPRKEEPQAKQSPVFNDFVDRFLEHSDTNNKPSTAYAKRRILENHLMPFFGKLRLDQITGAEVEKYKAKTLLSGELEKKTINNHLAVLRKLLNLAHEWNELAAVPKIKELRLPPQTFDFLSFEEAERFIEAAQGTTWEIPLVVALKTGVRAGELRALKWEDVDLVAGRIIVRRTLWRQKEGTPKGGKAREIPLCLSALAALKRQRAKTQLKRGYVFCHEDGTALIEHDIEGVVADVCRKAGIPKRLAWHELRHTFASHLVMRGTPLKAVQELMGHATIEMTMRYAHLSPDVRREAVEVLDRPASKREAEVLDAVEDPAKPLAHGLARPEAK